MNKYLQREQQRWLKHDSARWIRPDAARFLPPGVKLEDAYPALARKYSPSQPRVPSGSGRESGRWTSGGVTGRPRVIIDTTNLGTESELDDSAGIDESDLSAIDDLSGDATSATPINDSRVLSDASPDPIRAGQQYAQLDDSDSGSNSRGGLPIDLTEEERAGGHAYARHVGKSNSFLINSVREVGDASVAAGLDFKRYAVGSFTSLRSADRLVNSTIYQNQATLDSFVKSDNYFVTLTATFKSRTGYEAGVDRPNSAPYMNDTYSVSVVILKDAASARGWRIQTAFPRTVKE